MYLGFEDQSFGVHQQVALSAPNLLVSYSMPLCSPPIPVVFADWESAIPALGSGSLPERARNRSRSAALSLSKVPSVRHLPNHQ
jgi:hypothetical protein